MFLFNVLKHRNVFNLVVSYIIVVLLLLQIFDTLVPALRHPDWFHSGVAFLMILGFPIAILIAWAFELMPDDLKSEMNVDKSQPISLVSGRKLNFVLLSIMALALAYFAYNKFGLTASREAAMFESSMLQTQGEDADAVLVEHKDRALDHSIVVLDFVNMSNEAGNEYFTDGLAGEEV